MSGKVKIRLFDKLCGNIISVSPAKVNGSQIITRCTFSLINFENDWDQYVATVKSTIGLANNLGIYSVKFFNLKIVNNGQSIMKI